MCFYIYMKIKQLVLILRVTGNVLETSELLYSVFFCITQGTSFFNANIRFMYNKTSFFGFNWFKIARKGPILLDSTVKSPLFPSLASLFYELAKDVEGRMSDFIHMQLFPILKMNSTFTAEIQRLCFV